MRVAVLAPLSLCFAGCRSDPNFEVLRPQTTAPSGQIDSVPGQDARIAAGDALTVLFSDVPNGPRRLVVKVGSDGTITLPLVGVLHALGKTPTELEREIRRAYVPRYLVHCNVNVNPEERFFFVGGELKYCTRQTFTRRMTVLRAIAVAGGFTEFAQRAKIELRRANGGKTEHVNYEKALKDPKLDLPVFPGDQVIVPRRR